MKFFVTHTSALEYWRAYLQAELPACSRATPQPGKVSSTKEVAEFDFARFGISTKPVHLAVANAEARIQSQLVKNHIWSSSFPDRAFFHIEGDLYVISPDLCFLQLAANYSIAQLVLLGLELCGRYRLCANEETGFSPGPPLTCVQALQGTLDRCAGLRGYKSARRAANFIADGSASPMESLLVALLCLPTTLGGYGLELPCLNYRVKLQKRSEGFLNEQMRYCDLYWPAARLAVEYDSKKYHEDLGREAHDSARRTELGLEDVHVISVTREQVNSVVRFDELAHLLAKQLGKPLRIRRKDFYQRRTVLHRTLWTEMLGR